jgi:tetratricopeptide (TPR) repeat protein
MAEAVCWTSGTCRLSPRFTALCQRDRVYGRHRGSTLSAGESGTARLEEAVAACHEALNESTRERSAPMGWDKGQSRLCTVAARRAGERTARLDEAIANLREALEEATRERVPLGWAEIEEHLARANAAFYVKTRKPLYLDEALLSLGGVLEEYRKAEATYDVERASHLREEILAMKDKPVRESAPLLTRKRSMCNSAAPFW